ncbi:MAG: hypothetical protein ABSF63_15415 [Candidatus Bathyarchaeia archaeon]
MNRNEQVSLIDGDYAFSTYYSKDYQTDNPPNWCGIISGMAEA